MTAAGPALSHTDSAYALATWPLLPPGEGRGGEALEGAPGCLFCQDLTTPGLLKRIGRLAATPGPP